MTVIEHVLSRLRAIGITDIFGVRGDYAFPVNDAICNHPDINWIGCSNELNAAYAADGYARMTRRPAATLLHLGPGLGNGLANLHNARRAHSPVLNIVGDHATTHWQFDAQLQSDIETVRPTGKSPGPPLSAS